MEGTGRKNAAGSWLRWERLRRTFSVSMLAMAAIGFGIGFMFTWPSRPRHTGPDDCDLGESSR